MAKKEQEQTTDRIPVVAETKDIKNLICVVREQQTMLDSDLAMIYQVETKVFNQAINRNIERFPENFRLQLTKEEFDTLRSQTATSNGRGGRRYRPYMFTERGITMLPGVLRSDVVVRMSIRIMNTFVEMRRFATNSALLFEKVSDIELKRLEYQKNTDEEFDKVFRYIKGHAESEQEIFFDGQTYDTFSLIASITQKAQREIILIDGYVDVDTLNMLARKSTGVDVKIYTYANAQLTEKDEARFNAQYPTLTVRKTQVSHDRFIPLGRGTAYHIGTSIRDAGERCFAISPMDNPGVVTDLLNRLKTV